MIELICMIHHCRNVWWENIATIFDYCDDRSGKVKGITKQLIELGVARVCGEYAIILPEPIHGGFDVFGFHHVVA